MHERSKQAPKRNSEDAARVGESGRVPHTSVRKDAEPGSDLPPGTITWLQRRWSSNTASHPSATSGVESASTMHQAAGAPEQSHTRRSARQPMGYLGVLAAEAETAFREERLEDARRLLTRPLEALLHTASNGRPTDAADAELAAVLAARLAIATRDCSWLDYPFLLFSALRRLLPHHVIDEIQTALQQVPGTDLTAIKLYLGVLELRPRPTNSMERCLLRRVQRCCHLAETWQGVSEREGTHR